MALGEHSQTIYSDEIKFYETPEGVVTTGPFGRAEIKVTPSKTPGLVHLMIVNVLPDQRVFYQRIELDPEMAKLTAEKIGETAWAVEETQTMKS